MRAETIPRSARLDRLRRSPPPALTWLALAALLVAAAALLLYETRGTTFWVDEWQWFLHRRDTSLSTFLEPHNEHLSLVPLAIYKALFALAGTDSYTPYRLPVIAAHLGVTMLVYVYATRRVGAVLGLLAATLILLLGPAWQNFMWGFQVGWLISLGAGWARSSCSTAATVPAPFGRAPLWARPGKLRRRPSDRARARDRGPLAAAPRGMDSGRAARPLCDLVARVPRL